MNGIQSAFSRRSVVMGLLAGGGAAALAACGAPAGSPAGGSQGTPAAGGQPVEIKVNFRQGTDAEWQQKLIPQFQQKYPNIKVTLEVQPAEPEYWAKVQALYARDIARREVRRYEYFQGPASSSFYHFQLSEEMQSKVHALYARDIARRAPDGIDRPPPQARRPREILRQCEDRHRPPQRFAIGGGRLQPRLDQRGDPFADLHRRDPFRRNRGEHRAIDLGKPSVDHVERTVFERERGDVGVDPRRIRRHVARGVAPAIERGVGGDPGAELNADFVEREVLGHTVSCRPRSGVSSASSIGG